MSTALIAGLGIVLCAGALPAWDFDSAEALKEWVPNAHLKNVIVEQGILRADAVDWDPFFTCRGIEFAATPWQYVVVRIKADRSGGGELFWTRELEGKYGGFLPEKSTPFTVREGDWQDVVIFPFWQTEGTIRQFRLDVYDGAHFEIDGIRVAAWGEGQAPLTEQREWTFENGDTSAWRVHPAASELFAPPLALPVFGTGFVVVRMSAAKEAEGRVLWATGKASGVQSESFTIHGDGKMRFYNVEVQSFPSWEGDLAALGLRLPKDAEVTLESVALSADPQGPPELMVTYLGVENGVNRAGRPASILAQVENRGGPAARIMEVWTRCGPGLKALGDGPPDFDPPEFGERSNLTFRVLAKRPGEYEVGVGFEIHGEEAVSKESRVRFLEALDLPKADYVPEPRPIETDIEVCAYYFPGWNADAKWDCIRRVAPIRKPLLGYYDEANAECVDWQIKWAVENGISCFLVDWYWNQGNESLLHWFEAYRKARYRDMLEVAIMWANHLPPDSHTREDWRAVTQHWIDHYFNLDTYYHVNGKPAVFLWSPQNIRHDLGGTDAVKEAFAESQAMAKAAGYDGIEFLAMFDHDSTAQVERLLEEGYSGATNYHEWGRALGMETAPNWHRFADIAATAHEAWNERDARSGRLTYYPVADTGWDSRPWHGSRARVFDERTPADFERLLADLKAFAVEHKKPFVVLGPVNEWGEGSYIEPNTEFGFEMLEAIRRVFGKGSPESWPVNIGPADVGLGPYDFPVQPKVTAWTFDDGVQGWNGMMGVSALRSEDGALAFTTTTRDPALMIVTDFLARRHPAATLRMRVTGGPPTASNGQLFWAVGGSAMIEATSVRFPIETDGAWHTYTLNLAKNPRWRGRISTLRLDPCDTKDATVYIDHFRIKGT